MSIDVKCARKKFKNQRPFAQTETKLTKAVGQFVGPDVVVEDLSSINFLLDNGFYGQYIGQRMNFCNIECFPDVPTADVDNADEPSTSFQLVSVDEMFDDINDDVIMKAAGAEWLSQLNEKSQQRLYLSAEEVIYLVRCEKLEVLGKTCTELWRFYVERDGENFIHRFFTYGFFRSQDWTVRSGINFGGDFALYKGSSEEYHSSIIVRIVMPHAAPDVLSMIAMKRSVGNMKKAILLARLKLPAEISWRDLNSDSSVEIDVERECRSVSAKDFGVLFGK